MSIISKTAIKEAQEFRHATKTFDAEKKISQEDYDFLMEMARLTPSSIGLEPWKILNIKNQEIREKLFPCSWGAQRGQLDGSEYLVILGAKQSMYTIEEGYVKKMIDDLHAVPTEYVEEYTNMVAHMFDSAKDPEGAYFSYSTNQIHLLTMNLCNVAAGLEIDTCIVGGFDAAAYDKLLGDEMKLYDTKKWGASLCLALGYRAKEPGHPKTRKPLEEVVQIV